MNIDYKIKYLKYKQKYLLLTSQHGGKFKFNSDNNLLIIFNNYLFFDNKKKIDNDYNSSIDIEKIEDYDNLYIDKQSKKILEKYEEKIFQCELYINLKQKKLVCKLKKNVDPVIYFKKINVFNIYFLDYNSSESNTQSYAYKCYIDLKKKNLDKDIALMIAGNSGRPGGNTFSYGFLDPKEAHAYFSSQEESLLSNFVCNTVVSETNYQIKLNCINNCGRLRNIEEKYFSQKQNKLVTYRTCCKDCDVNYQKGKHHDHDCNNRFKNQFNSKNQYFFFEKDKSTPLWGFTKSNNSYFTVDNYNYKDSIYIKNKIKMIDETGGVIYNKPDYLSDIVTLSAEDVNGENKHYQFDKKFNCRLIFVAGPNMSTGNTTEGSMFRTFSKKALTDYNYFETGVKTALESGLIKCAENNINIVFIAQVSLGIYSNRNKSFKSRLKKNFVNILENILKEILIKHNYKFDFIYFVTGNFYEFEITNNYIKNNPFN